jgi:hypothetical protein
LDQTNKGRINWEKLLQPVFYALPCCALFVHTRAKVHSKLSFRSAKKVCMLGQGWTDISPTTTCIPGRPC